MESTNTSESPSRYRDGAAVAWAGVTLAAVDVLFAFLRDREAFLQPIAIAQSMSAVCIASAVLILVLTAVGRLRRKGSARIHATAMGVFAAGLVFTVVATPRNPVEEDGWPELRLVAGLVMAIALGLAARYYAAGASETARDARWGRFRRALLTFIAMFVAAWAWLTGFYEHFNVALLTAFPLILGGLLAATILAAVLALLRIDRVVYIAAWIGFAAIPWVGTMGSPVQPVTRSGMADGAPRHVFLIVVDTLRGDAPSYTGEAGVATPNMDALAADSVVFANAISPAPWTVPAMTSILSGVSPLVHHAIRRPSSAPSELVMLPEQLRDAGYYTVAVGKNPVLGPHVNMTQGFDTYAWYPEVAGGPTLGWQMLGMIAPKRFGVAEFTTEDLIDEAIRHVDAAAEVPAFMWLHIFDPHLPYSPPRELVQGQPPAESVTRYLLSFDDLHRIRMGIHAPGVPEQRWIRELYNAEVRYVDRELGRFLDRLKAAGIYDDALIVLTSDHGEEFWEHAGFEHGHTLYNELLHVPLLVKLPGATPAQTVDLPVAAQAITPTVLDFCGIPPNASPAYSSSLRPYWDSTVTAPDPIYSTGLLYYFDRESLVMDNFKFIDNFVNHYKELYNLDQDPGEYKNLAGADRTQAEAALEIINEMRRVADEQREALGIEAKGGEGLTNEAEDALRSIGYM